MISSECNLKGLSLNTLLSKAPRLKSLKLSACQNLNDDLTKDFPHHTLEELDLTNTNTTGFSLNKLFLKVPNIKSLQVPRCKKLIDDLSDHLKLTSLETLKLDDTTLSKSSIDKILNKARNLKNFNFNFDEWNLSDGPPLTSLEFFKLKSKKIHSSSLRRLWVNAPKLTDFELHCTEIIDDAFPENIHFPSLNKIYISCNRHNGLFLGKLLKKTLHLKSLTLINGLKEIGDSLSEHLNLVYLEELIVIKVNYLTLSTLLAGAPNLKTLNITSHTEEEEDLAKIFNAAPLLQLQELTLMNTKLNSLLFCTLLSRFPRLSQVTFYQCTITGDELPDNLDLSSLRELNISYCKISPKLLKELRERAPHVKIITDVEEYDVASLKTPPPIRIPKEEETLDADTAPNPSQQYNLHRIFYAAEGHEHPEPDAYRLKVFSILEVNPELCSAEQAFTLKNQSKEVGVRASTRSPKALPI